MPYNYNYYRRKRLMSEQQLNLAQMLQTVLVEDTGVNVGGEAGSSTLNIPLPAGSYTKRRWTAGSGVDTSGSTITWTDTITGQTLTASDATVTYNETDPGFNDRPSIRFAGGFMEGAFSLYDGADFSYTIIAVTRNIQNSASSGGALIDSWATNAVGGGSVANPLVRAKKVGTGKQEVSGFAGPWLTSANLYQGATWEFMDGGTTGIEIGAFAFDNSITGTANRGNFYAWDGNGANTQKLENVSMAAGYGAESGTPKTKLMGTYATGAGTIQATLAEFIFVQKKLTSAELNDIVIAIANWY